MFPRSPWSFSLALLSLVVGCDGGGSTEGTNPGECSDGADNDSDGAYDCEDSDCSGAPDCATDSGGHNAAPSGAAIAIEPAAPVDDDVLTCTIVTEAVDPNGDAVTYGYAWSVDGADAGLTTATVAAALTSGGQTWTCTVTPTDGTLEGPPATASATITLGNQAPSAPTVSISPASPADDDVLNCIIENESVDPEGEAVTYSYGWAVDGTDAGLTTTTVAAAVTSVGQAWSCSVTGSDGVEWSQAGTASVIIEAGVVEFIEYTNAAGGTMIFVPAGSFSMGSGLGDPDDYYVDHDVTLSHDFWLAQTETTRREWEADPGHASWTYASITYGYPCTGTTADCPADTMTWYDAAIYANWMSAEEGLTECYLANGTDMAAAYLADPYSCPGYRLPTEAEWEYAARAGVDTAYSGSNTAADVAWTYENASSMGTNAHEACSLSANAWGLCDMSGNLFEWTNDWYAPSWGDYGSTVATTDPSGPSTGSARACRGGDWSTYASAARVVSRGYSFPPESGGVPVGFRLARSIVP